MKFIKYLCFGLLFAAIASCDKYLEPKGTNQYGDETTWSKPDFAMGIIAELYAALPQNACSFNGTNYLDAITDNSLTTHTGSTLYQYVYGSQTMQSDPLDNWSTAYSNIALANLFIEKGSSSGINYYLPDPKVAKKIELRSRGEAFFLRAWWQHELLKNYGGLAENGAVLGFVIVTRVYASSEVDQANKLQRSDFETCVKQILNDCDSAVRYLPLQYSTTDNNDVAYGVSNYGRASGKAAMALKSRVALLAASPAYQPGNASATEKQAKWQRAATIAKQAIDSINKGIGTQATMLAITNDLLVGANVQTATHMPSFAEMLFNRFGNVRAHENNHFPPWFFGQGKCNPSQNLVNAYSMTNGYPITDPRSGYDSQNPYVNRDKRFVWTTNFNGGRFNEIAFDPKNPNRWDSRAMEIYSSSADGKIGRDAPGYDYRNTWTGYYLRKGLSDKPNMNYSPDNPDGTVNDYHRNPFLRRMEVWFNLAEALNGYVGPTGTIPETTETAADIIKRVRALYGVGNAYVDEVAAKGKDEFLKLILNERRLEFAFENMRFWDIRRWKLPLNEPILGITVYKDDENKFVYSGTNPGVDNIVVQKRDLLSPDKYYASPLPYAELVKNKNLVQNAGW